MKKAFVLLLIALLSITACSCNGQTTDPNRTDVTQMTDTVADSTTAPSVENDPPAKPEHVTLVDGRVTTDQYVIEADEDGCYLTFFEEYQASEEDKNAAMTNSIHFDSLEDMVDCFRNNSFEPYQRITMQATFPQSEKGIQVCDFNRLYNITKPAETQVSQVSLSGQYYTFNIIEEGMFNFGWVSYTSEEGINGMKSQLYGWSVGETITRQEETTFDGVPCEIVEYYNSAETYRDIYMDIQENGVKKEILIRYLLKDNRDYPERISDIAPWQVVMFCEEDGIFYRVTIGEMLKTPSYEWLSSFGLTPYVPASDGNMATE